MSLLSGTWERKVQKTPVALSLVPLCIERLLYSAAALEQSNQGLGCTRKLLQKKKGYGVFVAVDLVSFSFFLIVEARQITTPWLFIYIYIRRGFLCASDYIYFILYCTTQHVYNDNDATNTLYIINYTQ